MENKDKWIIGIDLDGTTISDLGHSSSNNKETQTDFINPFNKKVIKHLNDMGHEVVIATGRNWWRTKDIFKDLDMDGYVINNSGGHIHHMTDAYMPEFIKGVPKKIIDEILESGLLKDKIIFYFIENTEVTFYKVNKFVDQIDANKVHRKMVEFEGEYIFDPQCTIIALDHSLEDNNNLIEELRKKYKDYLSITNWNNPQGSIGIEIKTCHSSKGTALLKLAKLLEIPKENTMGICDGENDFDLINIPEVGVAMKNGCDYIKSIANLITEKDNVNAGLGHFLNDFFKLNLEE